MAKKPPIVVLDTNVWVSRSLLMLNTPLAASLLFTLQRRGGRLGLPEVVESELRKVAPSRAADMAQRYDDAGAFLNDMGIQTQTEPPLDVDKVRSLVVERLDDLEPFLEPVPITLDHVRSALERVNAELPPNGPSNQQFKDSLIWEAVVELSSAYEVTFLTGDKGFFEGREFDKGVARALRDQAEEKGITVLPPADVKVLLEQLEEGLTALQRDDLRKAVRSALMPTIESDGRMWRFEVRELMEQHEWLFLTDRAGTVSVQFELLYEAEVSLRGGGKAPAYYRLPGSCLYSVDDNRVEELAVSNQSISIDKEYGGEVRGQVSLLRGDEGGWVGPRLVID